MARRNRAGIDRHDERLRLAHGAQQVGDARDLRSEAPIEPDHELRRLAACRGLPVRRLDSRELVDGVSASGFSTNTCLPARSASHVSDACES